MKIKFRAWDRKTKSMILEVWEIGFGDRNNRETWLVGDDRQTNNFDLMQFTGLLDKNGKEIYEGDLIKTPDNRILPVIFKEGCFGFENNLENKQFAYFTKALTTAIEVVGNIYKIK
jgi:uncharacterized phage protein (TIGR01671 family)